jgi:hypothetical protein
MAKVKIWWTAEELRKFIVDFDEQARVYTATLPVRPRPISEVARLRKELAELKGQPIPETPAPTATETPAPVVEGKPAKKKSRKARKA